MSKLFIKNDGKIVREVEIEQINPSHMVFEAEEGSGINTAIYYADIFGESDWAKEKGYNVKTTGYQVHATQGKIDGYELDYDFIVQAGVAPVTNEPRTQHFNDFIKIIATQCMGIKNERTPMTIMMQLMSEVGELAEELRVKNDPSFYKEEGKDGILGEGCDILIALVDLLIQSGYKAEDIIETAKTKMDKWWKKAEEHRIKHQKYDVWVFNNQHVYKQYGVGKDSCFLVDGEYGYAVSDAIAELDALYRLAVCRWANERSYIVLVTPAGEVRPAFIDKMEKDIQKYIQDNGNNIDINKIERMAVCAITGSDE